MIAHKYSLRSDLKLAREPVFLKDTGVQFQRQEAAFSKLLLPPVTSLVLGSLRCTTLCTDLRSWTPSCTFSNSRMYLGPQPFRALYTNTSILYSTSLVMGNQCKSLNTGVICSYHFAPTRQLAAEF